MLVAQPPRTAPPAPGTAISMGEVKDRHNIRSSSRRNRERFPQLAASAPRKVAACAPRPRTHHLGTGGPRESERGRFFHAPTDPSKQICARQRQSRAPAEAPACAAAGAAGRAWRAAGARCRHAPAFCNYTTTSVKTDPRLEPVWRPAGGTKRHWRTVPPVIKRTQIGLSALQTGSMSSAGALSFEPQRHLAATQPTEAAACWLAGCRAGWLWCRRAAPAAPSGHHECAPRDDAKVPGAQAMLA
jgi:hypothetical protein